MVHGGWTCLFDMKYEDVSDDKNEQEFNGNQSKDEMSDNESHSNSNSWQVQAWVAPQKTLLRNILRFFLMSDLINI